MQLGRQQSRYNEGQSDIVYTMNVECNVVPIRWNVSEGNVEDEADHKEKSLAEPQEKMSEATAVTDIAQ